MPNVLLARAVTPLVCLSLLAGPLPARAEETVRCESRNFAYRYCRADTDYRVDLVRQLSDTRCRENRNWGYDRHGVWVSQGCAAEFRVGYRRGGGGGSSDKVAAGAAIVGLAAIAAIAASKNSQASEEVESWAVGSFSGYDDVEGTDVQITVLPGGSVSGRAGSHEFSGTFKGKRLEAGRHVFNVERSGNGFTATDERDARHRVVFQRVASGY